MVTTFNTGDKVRKKANSRYSYCPPLEVVFLCGGHVLCKDITQGTIHSGSLFAYLENEIITETDFENGINKNVTTNEPI